MTIGHEGDDNRETIRRKGNCATGCWLLAGGRRHSRSSRFGSQHGTRSCREQLSADLVEVGQRKHGLRSGQVLGQTAVSHFSEAPQLLEHPKGVFAARPGPRARPVDQPPALAQRPLGGRTPVDPIAHPPALEKLSIVFLPVRLIPEQLPLLPMQQLRQLGDVGYVGVRSLAPYGRYRADPLRRAASFRSTSFCPCGPASSRGHDSHWRSWSNSAPR